MAYLKKIIILNEVTGGFGTAPVKGMLNIERTPSSVRGTLNMYNLKDITSGDFVFGLQAENKRLFKVRLGVQGKINYTFTLESDTLLEGKLYCGLVYIVHDRVVPIAFGANYNLKVWESGFVDNMRPQVARQALSEPLVKTDTLKLKDRTFSIGFCDDAEKTEKPQKPQQADHSLSELSPVYADDAIAETNFYPSDYAGSGFSEAAATTQTQSTPYIATNTVQNPPNTESNKKENDTIRISTWGGYNSIKSARTDTSTHSTAKTETPRPEGLKTGFSRVAPLEGLEYENYYLSVKPQLDKIFKTGAPERTLNSNLPGTRWVKVDYNGTQYYIIGLIGQDPDYIGYGVPGKYSVNPPKELAEYCQWLPLDENSPYAEGYWMMYQDARTGAGVKLDIV